MFVRYKNLKKEKNLTLKNMTRGIRKEKNKSKSKIIRSGIE